MNQHIKELFFSTIEILRKNVTGFYDWKDRDDWIFANLEFTKEELEEIYDGRDELIYFGSAK